MSWRISILDKSPVAENETAADALARTLSLAQQAETLGYHRFWIAEHHNTPQLASPSPELLIAWILGQTKRIRVGSGGVMLQHYSPTKSPKTSTCWPPLPPVVWIWASVKRRAVCRFQPGRFKSASASRRRAISPPNWLS
ncbi:Limonene 1,2-monooxygenase [Leclercia adecarboxylata]|uniref:Limonene 1,2-monooxygenase n=1 Tax=Leclercia adecarboxylata TaxID=83655 RepID=A0A4U9HX83_9ENTR|nr:Limonene 1,2-monooxygenase [Leclercia adecarboxylata]